MATLVLVEVDVKQDKIEALSAMLKAGFPHTRAFDGCIDLHAYLNDNGKTFVMVEYWDSKAHYMKYYKWREESGALDQLQACFDGEVSIRFFDQIDA